MLEADAAVAQILEIDPAFTISQQLRVTPIAGESEALSFAHLLQKVGLPL